ncbi:LamG domain-containing protein, partial [Bacteroidales bacterium OttesenSCG-928-A17]|nr:LamG domain-containing protein [Bacteroidales bacterium OttesenSCG-928-A17]
STWESGFVLGCCDGSSNVINIQNVHVDGGLLQAVCRSGGIVGLAHIGATVNMTHVSCSAEIDPYYIPSGGHTEAGGIIGSLSTSSGSGRVNLYSVVFCGVLRCNETVNSRCGGIVGYLAAAAGAGVKLHASPVVMIGEIITNNNTANSIGLFGGYLAEPVTRTGNYFATPTSSLSKWGNNASFAAGEVVDTQQQVYDKISTKNPFYMSGGRLYLYKPNNPQPTNFSAVVENGRVKLSWNMLAGNYLTPNAGYSIQARKYQSSDAWKDVNVKEGNLNYNASETSKTVYVEFPDLNETATQYEFRIKRRAEVWVESLTNYYPITTCTLPAYSYPKNLTLSSNPNEGVLTLTWNMNVQEASAPAGNYNLQWKNVAGEWVSVLPEEITTGDLNYNRTETTKSIILPYLLMDRGNYEFLFRLKRDDYAGYLAQSQGLTVNTNITEFTSISGEGNQEGIYVKWEQDNGRLDKNWYFRLYRKNTNESDFGWISGGFVREIKASELSTRSLFDNDAVSCTPYHYVIRLEEGPQGINSVVKATSPILKDESVVRLDSRVGEIESLSVSKGYYNDRVDINWVVTAGNSFTRYSITRKEHGIATATTQNIYEFNQSSAQTTNYRYTDESAIPGNYYVYEVIAWQDCNGVPSRAHSFESVGFMQPLGVVSGKVTYEGGNAVPGVSIIAENDPESQFANRSLIFNEELGTVAKIPYKDNMLSPDAFTVQFWVNDGKEYKAGGEDVEQPYFTSAYHYTLHRKNKALEFLTWDKAGNALTYSFNYAPPANNYRHITITYAASGNTGTAKLYVNGELTEELSNTYTGGVGFATGIAEMDTVMLGKGYEDDVFFSGYMDEFRMWNKVLDEETIASNYDAYLSGKEMNLAIYYRFDEPIANALFDISGRNGVFNENHASVSNTRGSGSSPERSGSVPKCDNKALTDANGNYIISTIPYSGEGSRIEIRPELGVHNFNPKNKPLYFNKQSNTYNNVDFVDISSFTLTGKVVYSGGTYPAEGCQFEIDGKTVVKNNGEVVKSAQDGTFIISVPIGVHEVRVVKQGHTFANDGLILDEAGENINYNSHITLQEPLLNTTLVKVIGRAVGGLTEYEKPLGFGESLNNLGIETVALTAKNSLGYKLSEIETEKTYYHNEGRWAKTVLVSEDTTTVVFEENAVTIKVSPHTGEFVAWLPPISYTVASVKAVGYGDQDLFSSTETLDLTNVAISDENYMQQSVRQWTDSVEADLRPGELPHKVAVEMSDSIAYHAKWEYYYQSVPTFTVKQLVDNEKVEYFGDKEYTFEDALTGESETIDLWTPENNYFFADPLFRQGNKYTFSLEAYERYENKATQVVYPYPVQGTVTMENTISVNGNESIELDESGEATYTFIAGAPKDGKNSFQGRVKIGSVSYHWDRGNNSVEAWHLGDQISGTDFMTSGPDEISAILRDPPGSLSYSYIEKGSTITSTTSYDVSNALKETQNITTSLGPKITTFVGFGVGVITENETKIDVSAGLSAEQTWSYSGETTTTTTFTERFQTSDDPLYVGSLGDVFIGNSTNIQYGLTEGVSIQKNYQGADALVTKNAYSIAPSVSVAYGQTFDTQFAYTQVELEEIMIPKWKDNLKNLLQPKGTNVTPSSLSYPVYVSNLDEDDENFGKLNTDTEAFGSLAVPANQFHDGPSYTIYFPTTNYDISEFREDSVMWFNNQINLWADVLAQNEKEKVEMKKLGNYSFGAGASIEWSKTETASKSYTSSFQWMLNPSIGLETGFEVFGIGVSTTTTVEYTHTSSDSETDTEETSITTGFVLQEEGDDDEITVDYGMTESGTIAFKTRGGRTSCPYEPAVISKYFEPGKHILSEGTAQIEVPRIGVEGSSSKLNVPANKTANFVLKMDNDSETGEDVWFQLIVEEKTNPYGAELKIDGGIIGNGRMFLVEAGKSLLKTVTVGKGTVDTYDINLILRSECQSDPTTFLPVIADTTNIYVEFVPSCSNVNIKSPANNWIANTATGDVLNIVLDGFERDYSNLGYIALEARNTASNTWDELMRFYTDETIYTKASGQKTLVPSTDANISYNWTMPAEDATYELRASAVCVNTNEEGVILSELSRYTTEVVRGVKDMKKPQPLGNPSPANGILNIGDEISILFNEEIRQGSVTENQISVSGVLNETVIAEPSVGLNFAATGCAYTEQPITVNGSFAIEGWFRRPSNSEGTLFAFGSDGNYISIGFDTANKPVLKLGENTYTSNNTISVSDEWKYLSMTYNRESERVSVTVLEGTSTTDLFEGE